MYVCVQGFPDFVGDGWAANCGVRLEDWAMRSSELEPGLATNVAQETKLRKTENNSAAGR